LLGVKVIKETLGDVKKRTREKLGLSFDLDDWQGELIRRLRQGYDSLMVAGTGYGKSVIFEGLAALNKAKIVIVVCPLKALERDQVISLQVSAHTLFNCLLAGQRGKEKRFKGCDGQ
jgi:superfamily II DNA helicase RecQ